MGTYVHSLSALGGVRISDFNEKKTKNEWTSTPLEQSLAIKDIFAE